MCINSKIRERIKVQSNMYHDWRNINIVLSDDISNMTQLCEYNLPQDGSIYLVNVAVAVRCNHENYGMYKVYQTLRDSNGIDWTGVDNVCDYTSIRTEFFTVYYGLPQVRVMAAAFTKDTVIATNYLFRVTRLYYDWS